MFVVGPELDTLPLCSTLYNTVVFTRTTALILEDGNLPTEHSSCTCVYMLYGSLKKLFLFP